MFNFKSNKELDSLKNKLNDAQSGLNSWKNQSDICKNITKAIISGSVFLEKTRESMLKSSNDMIDSEHKIADSSGVLVDVVRSIDDLFSSINSIQDKSINSCDHLYKINKGIETIQSLTSDITKYLIKLIF